MSTDKVLEKADVTARESAKEKGSTHDRIIEAAIKLFSEKGFNGTTTKEIAETAEVNEALIFRHFSTKRDLYGAIIEKKISEEPGIELSLETHRDSKDDRLVFTAIASRMFEKCGRDPSFMRLLHFSALEGHDLSDMFFDTYVEYINMLISDYIDTRIKDGEFKKLNPLYSSKAFIGMVVNQIIVQELFGEKKKNKTDYKELTETFVEIFLDGIKSKKS
ncbi:MAG TPA: TetR/AcrR family transcriptional regulator [Thermodesulfobacteriota bacterium]|jgi:AcrR family transcriptional regulator|nr:TetR/AcrR family transcriptional regulator [Thermodesulfobacteriota bacterium]